MALPRATDAESVGTGSSGGTTLGSSTTEKISFYGVTPVAQISASIQTTITATIKTLNSSEGFSFKTSAGFNNVVNAVKHIQHVLKTTGLWKGSA